MASSRGQRGGGGRGERIFSLTTVGNMMKKALPPKARISADANETVEQCLTKFVDSVTIEATKNCNNNGLSELTGDDIISGLAKLGFSDYLEPLYDYLEKYRKLNEPEPSTSAVPVVLRHQISDGDYQNGILGVGTAEDFQGLPALILHKIY